MENSIITTTYSPLAVANTIIDTLGGCDHMKLQKLCYLVHGWSMVFDGQSFINERPQMWQYGPVFKTLYRALELYGTSEIKLPVSISPFDDAVIIKPLPDPTVPIAPKRHNMMGYGALRVFISTHKKYLGLLDRYRISLRKLKEIDKCLKIVKWVCSRYGHLSGIALSDMTHMDGTAWRNIAKENDFKVPENTYIDDEYVRQEFEAIKAKFELSWVKDADDR